MYFMNMIMISHETMQMCQDNLWLSQKGVSGELLSDRKFSPTVCRDYQQIFTPYSAYGLCTWAPG